jgi:hypothetical protein
LSEVADYGFKTDWGLGNLTEDTVKEWHRQRDEFILNKIFPVHRIKLDTTKLFHFMLEKEGKTGLVSKPFVTINRDGS